MFDVTKDDDVPMEIHEESLTEAEKYKKIRTQIKKDKMKEHLQRNLAKKKIVEDAFMKQAEQNQRDDLALASEPVTGGASSSQGPPPPKQPRTPKAKVDRSRSRDQEPKTPKSEIEMKSESEATQKTKPQKEPKEKKIKVQKDIERRKKRTQKNKERRTTRRGHNGSTKRRG